MHIIYEYFRESRTSFGYNQIQIKPEKYKSGFTANAKRKKKIVTTAIKKFGSALILEGRSANSKQTYFYFWPKELLPVPSNQVDDFITSF